MDKTYNVTPTTTAGPEISSGVQEKPMDIMTYEMEPYPLDDFYNEGDCS